MIHIIVIQWQKSTIESNCENNVKWRDKILEGIQVDQQIIVWNAPIPHEERDGICIISP